MTRWRVVGCGVALWTMGCSSVAAVAEGGADVTSGLSGTESISGGTGTMGDGDGDPDTGTSTGDGDGDGDPGTSTGDGDGDGDPGTGTTTGVGDGDGDGDPGTGTTTGDGDGDGDPGTGTTTGDGDGDGDPGTGTSTGDGDGDLGTGTTTGDGDGDGDPGTTTGDGDGDGEPGTTTGDGDGDPGTTTGDGDGDGDGAPGPPYTVNSTLIVTADGPGGDPTLDRFTTVLGSGCAEVPDLYANNHPGVAHIEESNNGPTGPYFTFLMHTQIDKDRDKYPTIDDRQRNEVKAYGGSVDAAKAFEGETVRYHWYFRLAADLPVTTSFSHFMQMKAVDGDDQQPVITLTARRTGGEDRFEVRHNASSAVSFQVLASAPLDALRGQWIEAEVIATHTDSGDLWIRLAPPGGEPVLSVDLSGVDLWRDQASFSRPKWGIYRSIANIGDLVNDTDTVDFADFTIQKVTLLP